MLISRRDMIKGLAFTAGAGAFSPFMMDMQAHAAGDVAKLPKRFVFLVRSNGLRTYGINPKGVTDRIEAMGQQPYSATYSERLDQVKLNESMQALEPFKSKLNIILGLSSMMLVGKHSGGYGALGAYRSPEDSSIALYPTIDAILAEAYPSIFSHLGLAVVRHGSHMVNPRLSATGKNKPLSYYADPMGAYRDLFGAVKGGKDVREQVELDNQLLDFITSDIKRVEKQLPGSEKDKLGYYLDAFNSMRKRDTQIAERAEAIKRGAPTSDDKYKSKLVVDRLEAHFEIAAAALITGMSRMVTVRMDDLTAYYKGLGLGSLSLHGYGHNETSAGRHPTADGVDGVEACARIRRCHFQLMAELAKKLDAVPEGDGTMLDNTLIVMLSDAGDTHHPTWSQFPVVTLGGLGGQLKTGQFIQYPMSTTSSPDRRSITNFYHSILHAAGMPGTEFGHPDKSLLADIDQSAPLPELMA